MPERVEAALNCVDGGKDGPSDSICIISPFELTVISAVIGLAFAAAFDSDELNVIGNVLIGIGGIMIIAASQGDFVKGLEEKARKKKFAENIIAALDGKSTKSRIRQTNSDKRDSRAFQ